MIRAACVALALLVAAGPAYAGKRPVKGVDIIVKKDPGDGAYKRVASTGAGRFAARNLEPGSYAIYLGDRLVGRKTLTSRGTISGTVTAPAGERGIQNKGVKGCETCVVAMD